MSFFYITVPTREYELILRQKESMIEDVHHVDTPPNPSIDEGGSMGHFSNVYVGIRDGRPTEIIVGDDFMEFREKASSPSSSLLQETATNEKRKSSSSDDVEAQIHKFFLEKHLEDTLSIYKLENAIRGRTNENKTAYCHFSVPAAMADSIIRRLQSVGIGAKYESSFIVCSGGVYCGPAGDSKKEIGGTDEHTEEENSSAWAEFVKSIKSRLTVAQVVSQIQSTTVLSFDFLMFVTVAAVIACLGLLENSTVILVASMLISPLMGPIMAITFGTVIRDSALLRTGFKSELIGLLICLLFGFVAGMSLESGAFDGPWVKVTPWPTEEMSSRGRLRSLVVGVLMAIPSGIGVALSILAGNAGSLVGVAIAASLLPPAVNCGLFWGLACGIWLSEGIRIGIWHTACDFEWGINGTVGYKTIYCKNVIQEFAFLGIVSFALTIINIIVIFVVAIVILKVKEVAPYATKSSLRKFWQEDLALTRLYNLEHGDTDIKEGIVNDLNKVDNQEEIHRALNMDPLIKKINTKVGGAGEIAVLDDIRRRNHTEIVLPKMKQAAPRLGSRKSVSAGWFSGWFGGGRRHSRVTHI